MNMRMHLLYLPLITSFFVDYAIHDIKNTITYKLATKEHATSLLNLINNHVINYKNMIVILPKIALCMLIPKSNQINLTCKLLPRIDSIAESKNILIFPLSPTYIQ